MADAQKVIELVFQGVDKTAAATQGALDNLGRVSGGIKDATQPIADFTMGALKLEAGIVAAGLAVTTFAIFQASKFESALFDLQKVLDESDGPIERFAEAARTISTEYGLSAVEVLQATANFKQAGFNASDALMLVRNALDLKLAGDIEAARGSELLVASLKGFGLEAKEAARIVDLLNAVSNEYATDVNELATGFAILSPVARAAGLSLEETAGILTPGIEVFRSGSEVANGLRTVLLRLQDDSKPVQEALAALGVTQKTANGELRSARDIYFDVAAAFGTLDDSQKTFIAAQLAGINQSAKFLAVVDGLGKTLRIAGDDFEYLGSAAKEVEIQLASAEVSWRRTKTAFENLFILIGAPLLDEFKGITEAIIAMFAAVGQNVQKGQLGGLVKYIEGLMGDIQKSLETVARNLPAALEKADLGRFQQGIQVVVDAFGKLFNNIDLSTVDGLAMAINIAGTAFLGLQQYVAGVIESFKPLFDMLARVGSGLENFDTNIIKTLGNIGGFVTQLNLLAGAVGGLVPYLETLLGLLIVKQGAGLAGAFTKAAGSLSGSTGLLALLGKAGLVGAAGAAGYAVGTQLNSGIDALVSRLTGKQNTLGGWIYDLLNGADAAEDMGRAVRQAGTDVDSANAAAQRSGQVWNATKGVWEDASTTMDDAAESARALRNPYEEANNALLATVAPATAAGRAIGELAYQQAGLLEDGVKIRPILDAVTGAVIGYERAASDAPAALARMGQASAGAANVLELTADQAFRATQEANKLTIELEKIASNERIRNLELKVQLDIARLQEDTKRIQAAFESINTTINSTGELLGSLFGDLVGASGGRGNEQALIRQQIDLENRRRQEALDMQKKLTEAQIKNLDAQTSRLNRGESLIKIEGDGLQPHLEAFMWEILRSIQMRVNQDGLEFLLGAS